ELLTGPTLRRALQSIEYLSGLTLSSIIKSPTMDQSAERLGILIGLEDADETRNLVYETLGRGETSNEFLNTIGRADLLEYAMGVLKPLKAPRAAISIMARLV